jgi:hypothetical protein
LFGGKEIRFRRQWANGFILSPWKSQMTTPAGNSAARKLVRPSKVEFNNIVDVKERMREFSEG